MPIQYLLDENLSPSYQEQLLRHLPDLKVLIVGDTDAPQKGTLDPEILCWCEDNGFILVTNNRNSMPLHLREHLIQGRHIPGILAFRKKFTMGQVIEDLILIALAAEEEEYRDILSYIPLLSSQKSGK